jgi:phage shock protein A
MQDYLGRLNGAQRDLLRDTGNGLLRSDRTWLRERAAWLEKLAILLEREPGWQQRVREAIAARDENVAPEYLRIYEHNLRLIHSAVAELLNSRTEKQDRRVRRKLSELREDLESLIAQGKAGTVAKSA